MIEMCVLHQPLASVMADNRILQVVQIRYHLIYFITVEVMRTPYTSLLCRRQTGFTQNFEMVRQRRLRDMNLIDEGATTTITQGDILDDFSACFIAQCMKQLREL
jgi:hypothetical protein